MITNKLYLAVIAALSLGCASLCSAQTSSPTSTASGAKLSTTSTSPAATSSTAAAAASSAPYTEGPVWEISMIKTKPGMDDDYLKQLSGALKPIYDEEKKQRIILDYKILIGDASGRDDFNILIMVQYPNMAALDGLRDKTEPIMSKVMGGEDQQRQLAVKRLDVREILGAKTMREITLK
jgi:hypothetical protein